MLHVDRAEATADVDVEVADELKLVRRAGELRFDFPVAIFDADAPHDQRSDRLHRGTPSLDREHVFELHFDPPQPIPVLAGWTLRPNPHCVGAHSLEEVGDVSRESLNDGHHRDDRTHGDDYADHGQHGAHLVRPELLDAGHDVLQNQHGRWPSVTACDRRRALAPVTR